MRLPANGLRVLGLALLANFVKSENASDPLNGQALSDSGKPVRARITIS